MSNVPPAYARQASFTDLEEDSPNLLPGTALDAEFDAIVATVAALRSRLAEIQRSDGALANQSVSNDQLATGAITGVDPPTTWATATAYTVNNSVIKSNGWYLCATAHTSGTFATDLSNGLWQLLFDADSFTTGPQGEQGEQGEPGTPGDALPAIGAPFFWPNPVLPDDGGTYIRCYGQAISRATYSTYFAIATKRATVTMTIANPCVVSWTAHGFEAGFPIVLSTSGALATGLTAGTTYYVLAPAANTFQLAATPSGAAIITTGSQNGTHTAVCAPFGDGDGSTTFNVVNLAGVFPLGRDNMGGSARGLVTFAGCGYYGNRLGGAAQGEQTHALTSGENATHTHTVTDTGHAHCASDPTHVHGASSGGTTTAESVDTISGVNASIFEAGATDIAKTPVAGAISVTTTVTAAATGVTIGSNTTGITNANSGSGTAHNNMPNFLVGDWIVRVL